MVAADAPQGRQLLKQLDHPSNRPALSMGRACEDEEDRRPAASLDFLSVVPPESSRVAPWGYDRERYRRRTEVERRFRRLRASAGSSRASTGPGSCSPGPSSLRSSSMHCVALTSPGSAACYLSSQGLGRRVWGFFFPGK